MGGVRRRLRALSKRLRAQVVKTGAKHWVKRQTERLEERYSRGGETALERFAIRRYVGLRSRFGKQYVAKRFAVVWSGEHRDRRLGIYLKGGCDLSSVFAATPLIAERLDGTCCIMRDEGRVTSARSDIVLQSLGVVPGEFAAAISERLQLAPGYFEPRLFEPTFPVPGFGDFPKSVVVLSVGSDVARTAYRHRESGLLVDPGGWWLGQSMERVLGELSTVEWFRKNFDKVGRLDPEQSRSNLTRIIDRLKGNVGAHVIVFNFLNVEPGSTYHSYQLVQKPMTMRIRRFNLDLIELSRELDFSIVDVDRILKRVGVAEQVDFAHFTAEGFRPVANEVVRILSDLAVLD